MFLAKKDGSEFVRTSLDEEGDRYAKRLLDSGNYEEAEDPGLGSAPAALAVLPDPAPADVAPAPEAGAVAVPKAKQSALASASAAAGSPDEAAVTAALADVDKALGRWPEDADLVAAKSQLEALMPAASPDAGAEQPQA